MMHERRRWCVQPVATPEELAQMLTQRTWTLCSGFCVQGQEQYLFLNDATHEDGALEMAVVRSTGRSSWIQIESITFSWCSTERALALIQATLRGDDDANDFARPVDLHGRLDRPEEHRHCHLCA
jgi:hypothetical protein